MFSCSNPQFTPRITPFSDISSDPQLKEDFRRYLRAGLAEENIDFYFDVIQFKTIDDPKKIKTEAKRIIVDYLSKPTLSSEECSSDFVAYSEEKYNTNMFDDLLAATQAILRTRFIEFCSVNVVVQPKDEFDDDKFKEFLSNRLALENLQFYRDVTLFRQSNKNVKDDALKIIENYINNFVIGLDDIPNFSIYKDSQYTPYMFDDILGSVRAVLRTRYIEYTEDVLIKVSSAPCSQEDMC